MNNKTKTIAVIGGGSWATAIVKILSEEENIHINWWLRKDSHIEHIKKFGRNPRYLSTVNIDCTKVFPYINIKSAIKGADFVIFCVPAAYMENVLSNVPYELLRDKYIVSAVKGMIPSTNQLITDYIHQKYDIQLNNMCVIAGPCHAEEVAQEKRSYITIASINPSLAKKFAELMDCRFVSTSTLTDVLGVEYCAIMKNIIALACGAARGLNYGDNFQSVLVSNAMQEIERFLDKIYPYDRNLMHSAYLGDLLVTTYSQYSRNRTLGFMVGRGYTVKSAQLEMGMVAEGYFALKSVKEINDTIGAEMPITQTMYHILYERIAPAIEFTILEDALV